MSMIEDQMDMTLVNVMSGVSQVSVLGLLLFLLYPSELIVVLENNLISYADGFTLIDVVPSSALEFLFQSPQTLTSRRLVSGESFGG